MNTACYSQIGVVLAAAILLMAAAPSPLRLHAAEGAGTAVPATKSPPQLGDGKNQGWEVKPPCVLSNMSTCPPGTEDFDSLDLMPLHLLGIPEDYGSAVKPKGAH